MLEQMGISVDYWTSTGNAMALSELNLKYFAPLRVHVYLHYSSVANKLNAWKISQNLLIFIYLALSSER